VFRTCVEADGEPLHPAAQRRGVRGLDDEVQVVREHDEVDDAEVLAMRGRDCTAGDRDEVLSTNAGDVVTQPQWTRPSVRRGSGTGSLWRVHISTAPAAL